LCEHAVCESPGHRGQIADAQLSTFEQRVDQLHTTRVGQHAERLSEILKNALIRKPIENGREALRFHALDRAASISGARGLA
jgi:hypothetical protein